MTKKDIFVYLVSAVLAMSSSADGHALDGAWRGDLSVNSAKLPLVFHFTTDDNGSVRCTLDSPMQGVKGLATEVTYCSGDSLALTISKIGASYSGIIGDNEISGSFAQSGFRFPLVLSPEQSIYDRRPQTPRPPFPYGSKDVTFSSSDGTMLAGTLTIPASADGDITAVVLVTGSGPQNRDEELFEHRPFAVIADYLARNGIASLRYDDRGVAKSGGDFKTSDIETFKADAAAAVDFLRREQGVGKVGVIGHSEGGTIALMLAADKTVDFAISMAGAIVSGKDLILAQNVRALHKLQATQKQTDDAMTLLSHVFDDIIKGKNYGDIDVDTYVKEDALDIPPVVVASVRQSLAASSGQYFRQLLSLAPSEWICDIKVPVFAINGSADIQVVSGDNLSALSQALPTAEQKEYPGLNHLFQHAVTGEIAEYAEITETISPEVLADITRFIKVQK